MRKSPEVNNLGYVPDALGVLKVLNEMAAYDRPFRRLCQGSKTGTLRQTYW